MSVKILYKMTNFKKRNKLCVALLENELSNDLFKFFTPYLDHFDDSCLKQMRYVIKIIKNCAEVADCHSLLL